LICLDYATAGRQFKPGRAEPVVQRENLLDGLLALV
jgi:hypothetical protein